MIISAIVKRFAAPALCVLLVLALAACARLAWQLDTAEDQLATARVELATERQGRADDKRLWAEAATAATDAAREVEQLRRRAQERTVRDAQTEVARLRAAAAAGAVYGLRQPAQDFAARFGQAACDRPAAAGGPPAETPIVVLADMLGSVDDSAAELAIALDVSYTAGLACERIHDSLREGQDHERTNPEVQGLPGG